MLENEPKDVMQNEESQDVNVENSTLSQDESGQQSTTANKKTTPNIVPALCIAAFFLVFADLIAATVLLINGIMVGAIVCAALFAVILISVVSITLISSEWALRNDIRKAKRITECKVERCIMSSMTTTKSNDSLYSVTVSVDGKEYTMSSNDSYESDDTVKVAIFNKKRARIVDELDLIHI